MRVKTTFVASLTDSVMCHRQALFAICSGRTRICRRKRGACHNAVPALRLAKKSLRGVVASMKRLCGRPYFDCRFLADNGLKMIARAHQLVQAGIDWMWDKQLVTVWSGTYTLLFILYF